MKTLTIDCQTGIYNTEYTMRDYGSHLIVTAPYVKWQKSNCGTLDFTKTKITNAKTMQTVRTMFDNEELMNDSQDMLQDILDGNYRHLPLN